MINQSKRSCFPHQYHRKFVCRVMSGDVDILKQILNKAEYDMKDYTD